MKFASEGSKKVLRVRKTEKLNGILVMERRHVFVKENRRIAVCEKRRGGWRFRRVIGSAGVDAILSSIPHQPSPGNLYLLSHLLSTSHCYSSSPKSRRTCSKGARNSSYTVYFERIIDTAKLDQRINDKTCCKMRTSVINYRN